MGNGYERPLACVLCNIRNEGKVLLIRRNKEPYKGLWSFPGGKIETGESIEGAALRETKEETGIDGNFVCVNGVVNEVLNKDDGERSFIIFLCTIDTDVEEFVECDEGKLEWFAIEELPSYDVFPDREYFDKLRDKQADVPEARVVEKEGKVESFEFIQP